MSQSQQLHQLQLLDSQLDEATRALAEIEASLGESDVLKQTQAAVESAEQSLRKAQSTMLDLDLEVKGLTEKIDQQEKLLYSGSVVSAKEASNLQDEVASLKRWQGQREELLLESMVEVEELEKKLEHAQTELASVRGQWAADQKHLRQKKEALESRVAELKTQRLAMVEAIDPEALSEYEALRPKKGGRAVALIKNGVCQGCGIAASNSDIQRARAGEALIFCTTCGRILHIM